MPEYCQQCGEPVDGQFCANCGADQHHLQQSDGISRRAAALGIGGALVAGAGGLAVWNSGALDSSPTHTLAPSDAWTELEREETVNGVAIRARVELDAGEYTGHGFYLDGVELAVNVLSVDGGPVDIWGINDDERDGYDDGTEVQFLTEVSETNVDGSYMGVATPRPGDYWIIVDNSGAFGSSPEGSVEAELWAGVGIV